MAYIGNIPAESYASFERQVFTIVNSQTAYTLTHAVTNENDIRLVINSVVQEPGSGKAYTASNTTLTLSAALVNGTDEMYCVYLGRALQTVNPPNASVGSSQVAASIITGQTALDATPADTDELLISDAGTLKRVDFSHLKSANTPAFAVKLSGDQTISSASETKITFDSELYDTDNAFASNKFTVPSGKGGKYFINFQTKLNVSTDYRGISSTIYKNGSAIQQIRSRIMFNSTLLNDGDTTLAATGVLDLSASDYIEGYAYIFSPSGGTIKVLADTYLTGFKLIG